MRIYSGFTYWKWWFSILMLKYQRVKHHWIPLNHHFPMVFFVFTNRFWKNYTIAVANQVIAGLGAFWRPRLVPTTDRASLFNRWVNRWLKSDHLMSHHEKWLSKFISSSHIFRLLQKKNSKNSDDILWYDNHQVTVQHPMVSSRRRKPKGYPKSYLDILSYMGASIDGAIQHGWFIMEHPIKMNDLGVPPFQETSIWSYTLW